MEKQKPTRKLRDPRELLAPEICDRWVTGYQPVRPAERPGLVILSGFFRDSLGSRRYLMSQKAIDMTDGSYQIDAASGLRITVWPVTAA